jgi:type II secretory pathway pseudopilin PulG
MRKVSRPSQAFTFVELLVVLGIMVVLAALLFPALASARAKGKRTVCINNLKQANLAVRMYAEDHDDTIELPARMVISPVDYHLFKEQVKRYLALSGPPSRAESIFACPADTFYYSAGGYRAAGLHEQAWSDFTSYAFNGMNRRGTNTETGVAFPGIAGKRLAGVHRRQCWWQRRQH